MISLAQVFQRRTASSLAGGRIASAFSYQVIALRSQSKARALLLWRVALARRS